MVVSIFVDVMITPEERRELKEKRDQLTPERRKRSDDGVFFGLDDEPEQCPNG